MGEDVCLWEMNTLFFIGYSTECDEVIESDPGEYMGSKEDLLGSNYVYCPYCGRRISFKE